MLSPLHLSMLPPQDSTLPELVERISRWWKAQDLDPSPRVTPSDEAPLLATLHLHPATEGLFLRRGREGQLGLEARTSLSGPGYHHEVLRILVAMQEELGLLWRNEQGLALKAPQETCWERCAAQCEQELSAYAAEALNTTQEHHGQLSLLMPAEHSIVLGADIATPLGPRARSWLETCVHTPAQGHDIYPWWHKGRGAKFYLNLALTVMWTELRWRPPLNDGEERAWRACAAWLEKAYALDPELSYPWYEWNELLQFLGEDSLIATRVQLKAEGDPQQGRAAIGYRRKEVRVRLSGGWSMVIPGVMAESWEDRSSWLAWDRKRSCWFSSFQASGKANSSSDSLSTLTSLPPLGEGERYVLSYHELEARAVERIDPQNPELKHLEAQAAVGNQVAVATFSYPAEDGPDWALEAWRSLGHPALKDTPSAP